MKSSVSVSGGWGVNKGEKRVEVWMSLRTGWKCGREEGRGVGGVKVRGKLSSVGEGE